MILPSKEFLEIFKNTNGALSVTESIAIMNYASIAPFGIWCELGVFKGKSAMSALQGGSPAEFHLVDPEFEKTISTDEVTDKLASTMQEKTILAFLVTDSIEYLSTTNFKYSYVFVDSGSHGDGLPMAEVKLLEDRIVKGGVIAFHDLFSQFVEVEEAYNYLRSTGKYEEIILDKNKIIEYVRESDMETGNISWHHQDVEFPCFVGALIRK